jgi:hemerythrin-like domain-containing protein
MVLEEIAAGLTDRLTDAQVQDFAGLYEAHLALEEEQLLPMAERLLGDAQLDEIGSAMRARRGVGPA